MDELKELKVRAYDLMVMAQSVQNELRSINMRIAQMMVKEAENGTVSNNEQGPQNDDGREPVANDVGDSE